MESLFLIRDQAQSLWSGSNDSKTLDYRRTNPTATTAKSLQLCPTLCDPTDGSPSGSLIPGILQVRTLEWVAISFSSAWKWKVKVKSLSREYQIVRTNRKETTWIQDLASPNHQMKLFTSSKQQTKQKYKPSHQQTGLPPHSALPIRGKNKQKLSTNSHPIRNLHKLLDQP